MYERRDLQRLLRDRISALGEDLLVIAEEFGEWQDARRRIDLLALDSDGRLVVIEIKRTDDGGHMELQAIRYAAMVSSMGLDEVTAAYADHCAKHRPEEEVNPRAELQAFLDIADNLNEPVISTDVRIILVSADFGREITTSVLWLNGFDGMDIRCVRLIPYKIGDRVLLDIQQVLPLPEAADYQVRLRRKEAARDRARTATHDYGRYHISVDGTEFPHKNKRQAMRVMVEQLTRHGVSLRDISRILPTRAIRMVEGRFTDGRALRDVLAVAHPNIDLNRWFCDHPLVDESENQTYVLSNQWGRDSAEPALAALANAFPEAKITFRRVEPAEE